MLLLRASVLRNVNSHAVRCVLQAEMGVTLRGADYAFRRGFQGTQSVAVADAPAPPAATTNSPPASESDAELERFVKAKEPPQQRQAGRWGLSTVFLAGIKSMGRAVKLTGQMVERVNDEAQDAMGRYTRVQRLRRRALLPSSALLSPLLFAHWRVAAVSHGRMPGTFTRAAAARDAMANMLRRSARPQIRCRAQANMSTTDSDFMAMLNEADVTAASRWPDVQRTLSADARFQAVVGEHKLTLFRDFVRMRAEVDDVAGSDAERNYMVRAPPVAACARRADRTLRPVDPRPWRKDAPKQDALVCCSAHHVLNYVALFVPKRPGMGRSDGSHPP
jgi:FF domain